MLDIIMLVNRIYFICIVYNYNVSNTHVSWCYLLALLLSQVAVDIQDFAN